MRTQLRSRVLTRRRAAAGLAALVLPLGIVMAGSAANAAPAPGSPLEIFISPNASDDVADAIQHGWWGHEGAPNNGTGTGTSFYDLDFSDADLAATFPDLANIRVAFVTTSSDGSAEHPVATAGQTVDQVFGANSWFQDASFGTSLDGNTNANDSVATVSTPAEFNAWFQAGSPLQGYDSSLALHDVLAPGNPVSATPQGKSILNRWPAGSHISLVFYQSTGAVSNGKPVVQVGADGHAKTAYMPFTTVAKSGDAVRTSAGYTDESFGQPAVTTTTTVAATPASPQVTGTAVSLDATVTAATGNATGSVEFFRAGTTSLGTAAVSGGHAVLSNVTLPVGTHSITATYTPSGNFASSSTASPLTYQITAAPATPTHVALSAVEGADSSVAVSMTATVTADDSSCPSGAVAFKDGAVTVETVNAPTSSPCVFAVSHLFGTGSHSLTAVFTPAGNYGVSSSAPVVINPAAPVGVSTNDANVTGTVPVGTIVITTPYTPASPLDLGNLHLTTDLSMYTASAPFEDIHLLNQKAGALPWTVTAQVGSLVNGANSINGQNVGLTGLVPDNVTGASTPFTQQPGLGTVTVTDRPAAAVAVAPAATGSLGLGGSAKTIIAGQGPADVQYKGTLTLNAPTTTQPGQYAGTITFTAS